MTIHLESNDITKSYKIDTEDPEAFIYQIIQDLYDNAGDVKEANIKNFPKFIPEEEKTDLLKDLVQKHFDKVCVIGFNSSEFDIKLLNKYLINDFSNIIKILGDCSEIITEHKTRPKKKYNKEREIDPNCKYDFSLRFIDILKFIAGGTLRKFIQAFSNNNEQTQEKGFFPYEAFNLENINEVLNKEEPFKYEDFKNSIEKRISISPEQY
jgi:hypothetical protein